MFPLLVLLISLLAAHSQAERVFYAPEEAEHHFEEFIATYNRQYADEREKETRLYIFKKNLEKINELNSRSQAIYGITQFTDMTIAEVFRNYTGFIGDSVSLPNMCKDGVFEAKEPAPDSLDWRIKGKVSRVKNQQQCGSCWAFSTIGNLEGQYAIKFNKLVEFSEQQLVDCDKYDSGCQGGLMSAAMTWLNRSGGAELEKDYPYEGKEDACKYDKKKVKVQVTDCYIYDKKTEDELKQILAEVGPLAIALDMDDLHHYKEGVAECNKCSIHINHALLLVGYGKDGDKPYWLIKNSWGENWGEMGYFRLAMYKNSCQILSYVVSAVIA